MLQCASSPIPTRLPYPEDLLTLYCREELRDQHAIGEEIATALTAGTLTDNLADEDELEEELAALQEEQLDEKMLKTGSVPIGDRVDMLPTPQQGSKLQTFSVVVAIANSNPVKGKTPLRNEEDEEEEELKRLQAEMAM